MAKVILDTNILIEILKNNQTTLQEVEKFDIHCISEITKMELYFGALNKQELKKLEKFLTLFEVLPLNSIISKRATELIYKYAKSHHLNIPDALIAATALDIDCKLLSYNTKDFKYIDNLKLIKP